LRQVCAKVVAPKVLLERDGSFPPEDELNSELDLIAEIVEITARSSREAIGNVN
jgi:uncharacterized protein (UPF0276 family)